MPARRPTLRDVAAAAGVHPSTASRVLRPHTRGLVSEAVARRVERVVRRLGYAPDAVAAGLRTKRTATIGVLIPDIANPVFPPILRGIERVLVPHGYTAIVANTDNLQEREWAALAELAARRVDGVVVASARWVDDVAARCGRLGLPAVLVNRRPRDGRLSAVITDDEAGAAQAVAHLVGLGHRAIGHVGGPVSLSTGRARRAGFLAATREAGLRAAPVASAARYDIASGAAAARRLLDHHSGLTAIVAANDLLALGVYDELGRRGLACPGDVSVTGFNDMTFCDRFDPPLSTVAIAHERIGEEAARLVLASIADPARVGELIRLDARLVVRGSTAPPRRAPRRRAPG